MTPIPLKFVLSLAGTVLLGGCGYHRSGSVTHLPAAVRTVSVPVFASRVQAFQTEMVFTKAVIRELETRTGYRIVNSEVRSADAVLRGTVLTESAAPLTYDSTSGQTSSYLVTITAKVVLTARDGQVLYENDAFPFHEQYQSTVDLSGFIQEDAPAVQRLSRDFAEAVVSDMLESW